MTAISLAEFDNARNLVPEILVKMNREDIEPASSLGSYVFPSRSWHLMAKVSGLVSERGFASHRADFWLALSKLLAKPFANFSSVLEFVCSYARLGRMFTEHTGAKYGCDIDAKHVKCLYENPPFYPVELARLGE